MRRTHSITRLPRFTCLRKARTYLWVAVLLALPVQVNASERSNAHPQASLLPLYKKYGAQYDVDWAVLAAIDRYAELTKSKDVRERAPYYGYAMDDPAWSGPSNPNPQDVFAPTIALFGGLGQDANGDRLALPFDAEDRIKSLARFIDEEAGEDEDQAVWTLFQDPVAVERVNGFARIFHAFGIDPQGHAFPIDKRYNYTIKHTFGAGRSYGGRRIHEGVDIFASYGTPVLACAYGYVELMGWNRYGGWRIGIRDANNTYYYYAHLSAYAKSLRPGDLVRPGQVIGYVGSTGYGPPGTAGKFPPHLHFGMYKDTGRREWAFNPSAYLLQWQRQPQLVVRNPVRNPSSTS
ncbi:M23 family metallopeptidase [Alicyclobacillus sendaiensis]|uniref:M23 family metallopeptidase n=1 Tax=Alicyclobacillus sendaiensis TaxID=192387 RepID=UPI000AE79DD8|nr:M23 family metallopeptidase [Alicyclobacillus sendaiensis]